MNHQKTEKGFFVPLNSEEALDECLSTGLYGQFLSPQDKLTRHHANIIADYASANPGDHIFFFTNRRIYYAGQLDASTDNGSAVYYNSPLHPFEHNSNVVFSPKRFDSDENGVFSIETRHGLKKRCQPYLLSFTDSMNLKGANIRADKLYNTISSFAFPLQSNTIEKTGFSAITPGETQELLTLLQNNSQQTKITLDSGEKPPLTPMDFSVLGTPASSGSESEVEATVLANPELLPNYSEKDTCIRQVPMSAFKPSIDYVDIGLYDDSCKFFPHTVHELKFVKAGKQAALQAKRYLEWASQLEDVPTPMVYVYAPEIRGSFESYLDPVEKEYIKTREFDAPKNIASAE